MRSVAKIIPQHTETGKLLAVRRAEHDSFPLKWEFPGGSIESHEDPEMAATRELLEETGFEGEPVKHDIWQDSGFEIHVFHVEVSSEDVALSEEHDRFQWIHIEEIEKLDTTDWFVENIELVEVE